LNSLILSRGQSSCQINVPPGRKIIAHGFNRGLRLQEKHKPRRGGRKTTPAFCRPFGTRSISKFYPRLKPWAVFGRPAGALN
jgi:hypothetical protein